jgi:hypothetical protein
MMLTYHPPLYLLTTHEDIKIIIGIKNKKLVKNLNNLFIIKNSYLDLKVEHYFKKHSSFFLKLSPNSLAALTKFSCACGKKIVNTITKISL